MIHSRHELILIVIRYFPLNCCTSHNTTGTNLPITKIVKFSNKRLKSLKYWLGTCLIVKTEFNSKSSKCLPINQSSKTGTPLNMELIELRSELYSGTLDCNFTDSEISSFQSITFNVMDIRLTMFEYQWYLFYL